MSIVFTSQTILPSVVEYARMWPSTEPENATPGSALTAADWAGLHRGLSPHPTGGGYHPPPPVSSRRAKTPPPRFGSASVNWLYVSMIRPMSDTATYTF